jgi:hypothetical protein
MDLNTSNPASHATQGDIANPTFEQISLLQKTSANKIEQKVSDVLDRADCLTDESQGSAPWEKLDLSVVMPCLNEADTVAACVRKAVAKIREMGVRGEVIVADNGSTDGSQSLARAEGATVVDISQRGYGAALMGGIAAARGQFVIMGDADDSYDFTKIDLFYEKLAAGMDLVQGCRLPRGGGTIEPGAMPPLHRWLGNPLLSFLVRTMFCTPVNDVYCGLRGFKRLYRHGICHRNDHQIDPLRGCDGPSADNTPSRWSCRIAIPLAYVSRWMAHAAILPVAEPTLDIPRPRRDTRSFRGHAIYARTATMDGRRYRIWRSHTARRDTCNSCCITIDLVCDFGQDVCSDRRFVASQSSLG